MLRRVRYAVSPLPARVAAIRGNSAILCYTRHMRRAAALYAATMFRAYAAALRKRRVLRAERYMRCFKARRWCTRERVRRLPRHFRFSACAAAPACYDLPYNVYAILI